MILSLYYHDHPAYVEVANIDMFGGSEFEPPSTHFDIDNIECEIDIPLYILEELIIEQLILHKRGFYEDD